MVRLNVNTLTINSSSVSKKGSRVQMAIHAQNLLDSFDPPCIGHTQHFQITKLWVSGVFLIVAISDSLSSSKKKSQKETAIFQM